MAVVFVVYLPNEDSEYIEPVSPSPYLLPKSKTANGTSKMPCSDDDDGGENEAVVPKISIGVGDDDEFSVKKPLLTNDCRDSGDQISSTSSDKAVDDAKCVTKHQSLLALDTDKSIPRRSSENVLAKPENTESDSVVYKGNKVRFQVTKLDTPGTDGAKQSATELSASVADMIAETKEGNKESSEQADVVMERLTLKEVVREVLNEFDVDNDFWETTCNKRLWHLRFMVSSAESDDILDRLIHLGLGRIPATSVSLFSTTMHYHKEAEDEEAKDKEAEHKEQEKKVSTGGDKSEFIKSIKSRLTVSQVVLAVQNNAKLTFDYVTLSALASMLAALGLAESSSVVLVASMLVSPLMGPIVGFTFGAIIKNDSLWRISVRNELIGLLICLSFGFLFGLISGGINNTGAAWGATDSWPTMEMQARGLQRSLWVGVLIAVPSGAGVALSILGGNTGSLVGVAISASLLPPAVNAGILWGLALVAACSHPEAALDEGGNLLIQNTSLQCAQLNGNNYEFVYSCHMSTEAAILGTFSLLLTIINIICIFIAGIFVLKIKEIAPHTALTPETEAFWKKDIPVTRATYKTVKGQASASFGTLARQLAHELKANQATEEDLKTAMEHIKNDPEYQDISEKVRSPDLIRQLSAEFHSRRRPLTVVEPRTVDDHYMTVNDPRMVHRLLTGHDLSVIDEHVQSATTPTTARPISTVGHTARPISAVGHTTGVVVRVRRRCTDTTGSRAQSVILLDKEQMNRHAKRTSHRPRYRRLESTPSSAQCPTTPPAWHLNARPAEV